MSIEKEGSRFSVDLSINEKAASKEQTCGDELSVRNIPRAERLN